MHRRTLLKSSLALMAAHNFCYCSRAHAMSSDYALGDTAFNDPRHHGEPQFRAAMVRAGFDSAELSLDAAFERGMKYAGLA
jgi:hypothetical protein